ncbi:hypothetical protein [Virgisporangium aurantiacum]|uniref:Uncharacterized protein n=1 Tax=Virgisporangium aurantiacum TaxID=175570 RepID=A0A8J3ZI77_9ACTN|nr:hypothetical protein [Virgisporangium aurantiacum]GIJ64291.1 hypothetical protein Vau01_118070 [Virgisporangium aurantiacum]
MAQSFQLIDFNQVDVVTPMIYPPRPALVVGGVAPFPGAEVSLVPLEHIGRPPYRGIQVVCTAGDGTQTDGGSAAYSVQIDLAGITGLHGVELIGATRTARIDVPTEDGA